ncbi:MAG: type II CAAX endopeptidase family protein [Ancrocorticia sp.]
MKTLLRSIADVAVILLLSIVAMMAGGLWLESWDVHPLALPVHYFIAPLVYLAIYWRGFAHLKKRFYRDAFPTVSFPPRFKASYFAWAFALVGLCSLGILAVGVQVVFPQIDPHLLWQFSAGLLGTMIIMPFLEEVTFRVVILGQIAKRYGIWAGMTVSSLVFAAMHMLNGRLDLFSAVQLLVGGFLMGMVLSVAYLKGQSMWFSFTIHAVYNSVFSLIVVTPEATPDWPVQFVYNSNNQLLSGGIYGFDVGLTNMLAYEIVLLALIVSIHRQGSSLPQLWERINEKSAASSEPVPAEIAPAGAVVVSAPSVTI